MKVFQFKRISAFLFLLFFLISCSAWANIEQMKLYKEAFGEPAKCIQCHVDKIPKKDAGMHEPNDYGKKVLGISATPTVDTYKTAGKAPAAE